MKSIYTDFYRQKRTKDEAPTYIAKEIKIRVIDDLVKSVMSYFEKIVKK